MKPYNQFAKPWNRFTIGEMDRVVDLYVNHKQGLHTIAKQFDCSITPIEKILNHRNIERKARGTQTKHSCNHDFFSYPLNELSEYWFGFIVGDGHISTDTRGNRQKALVVGLHNQDLGHLKKLKTCLEATQSIFETDKNCSKLAIVSQQLCVDLEELGRKPFNKTEVTIPLTRHILRGLVDSDGCFNTYYDKQHDYVRHYLGFLGGEVLLHQVADFIHSELGIKPRRIHEVRNIFNLKYHTADALDIVCWLYENCSELAKLDRKVKIAKKEFLNNPYQEYYGIFLPPVKPTKDISQTRSFANDQGTTKQRRFDTLANRQFSCVYKMCNSRYKFNL